MATGLAGGKELRGSTQETEICEWFLLRSLLKQSGWGHPRRGAGGGGRGQSPLVQVVPTVPSFLLGPRCPLPFNTSDVAGGVIVCERASGPGGAPIQQCQLLCRRGYRSAFLPGPLVCSLKEGRWLSQPPQPQACQRECPPSTLLSPGVQDRAPASSLPKGSIPVVSQVASGAGERPQGSTFF